MANDLLIHALYFFSAIIILLSTVFFIKGLLSRRFRNYYIDKGELPPLFNFSLFYIIGIGMLIGSVLQLSSLHERLSQSILTTGTIVDVGKHIDYEHDIMYRPRVEFVDKYGETWQFSSSVSSSSTNHFEGEVVDVYYYESQPENARLKSFTELYLFPSVTLLFGIVFTLIPMYGVHNPGSVKPSNRMRYRSEQEKRDIAKSKPFISVLIMVVFFYILFFA